MAAPQSPIGSRRRLGAELRRLRLKTGLTLDDVAEKMTCSTSKISRLETGKGVPKVPDVRELMRIYGVASDTERDMLLRLVKDGREQGWWEPITEGVTPERYVLDSPSRYASLESDAVAVRSFDLTIIHGLLQTAAYTRAVLSAMLPQHLPAEVERLVTLRQRRQEALHREVPPPLRLHVLLDEAALRRVVGGADVAVAQLRHLLEVGDLPNVMIQVVPFDAGVSRGHAGHFVLLDIPEVLGSNVVYVEGHAGETYLDSRSDVDLYSEVFDDVCQYALTPSTSRRLIARCLDDARHPERQAPHD